MSKAATLIKDSFIVDPWMEKHYLDTSPPRFKFVVLSAHKDPLSRQLNEVIMIGNNCDGELSKKKNKFGLFKLEVLELYLR